MASYVKPIEVSYQYADGFCIRFYIPEQSKKKDYAVIVYKYTKRGWNAVEAYPASPSAAASAGNARQYITLYNKRQKANKQ